MTPVTAAPGMLVRRGYDLKEGEEGETAAGEVRTAFCQSVSSVPTGMSLPDCIQSMSPVLCGTLLLPTAHQPTKGARGSARLIAVRLTPNHHTALQVGVLRATPDMSGLGRAWVVEWASGSQGVYETGWGGRFELVHLETSRTSGAPVVGRYSWLLGDTELAELRDLHEQACIYLLKLQSLHAHTSGGMAVERGTHWLYGGADPGVGITKSKTQGQEGEHSS